MLVHDPAWLPAGIDFRLNTTVNKVDIAGKTVSTTAGDKLSWEKLIIATGCVVRVQPALSAV